jgi:hypothetical protein
MGTVHQLYPREPEPEIFEDNEVAQAVYNMALDKMNEMDHQGEILVDKFNTVSAENLMLRAMVFNRDLCLFGMGMAMLGMGIFCTMLVLR